MDNYGEVPTSASPEVKPKVLEVDPIRVANFEQQMKEEQNLLKGLIAGAAAAILGAVLWAVITVITDYQIGWMAVGVGFLVGVAVRWAGRGVERKFGFAGAGLALLGCLGGNYLAYAAIIAQYEALQLVDVLLIFILNPGLVVELMVATFTPLDLLFYALALYQGYRFSFRRITDAELNTLLRERPQPL